MTYKYYFNEIEVTKIALRYGKVEVRDGYYLDGHKSYERFTEADCEDISEELQDELILDNWRLILDCPIDRIWLEHRVSTRD
jgi:hypothetical protein